jgi:hypothetical protein
MIRELASERRHTTPTSPYFRACVTFSCSQRFSDSLILADCRIAKAVARGKAGHIICRAARQVVDAVCVAKPNFAGLFERNEIIPI